MSANPAPCLLVTGATGKVGQTFIPRFLADSRFAGFKLRALCHHRKLPPRDRLEVVSGSISQRTVVTEAMAGVTHVLHLATCKETPDDVMDVAVKGMFWLLEAARASATFRQFILIGGDAAIGHFFYPRSAPVTESQPHHAYPGCYALSKVLEEVMLEQYYFQYDFNGCCLRAPWIMEKDDFKYQLSFGPDVFGGPRWGDLVGPVKAAEYISAKAVPVMQDATGKPIKRNFVHVDDLIGAIFRAIGHPATRGQTFNICMDEPVDYGDLAAYLATSRGLPSVEIRTPYHSTWLDNTKAKLLLGWRPQYDLKKMTDAAWNFQRSTGDPRIVWYPG
ncbi:MAG TPA: NAD(P)-dependent oxidoreductase [Lacunisphaera sp.]|jgi:nucleoside-diphosphate-sugar epimerase